MVTSYYIYPMKWLRQLRFSSPVLNRMFVIMIGLWLLQMYLNTGTLSGYAATLENPTLYNGYYVNYDWQHYVANYKFMMGKAPVEWQQGAVLRRELLFVLGYPFYKLFGFYAGGMTTILLILLITCYCFIRYVEEEYGSHAAIVALLLLTTYTGVMYWIGSPFAQNLVVPVCLWVYMLLHKITGATLKKRMLYLGIIGILFTGYDFIPLLGPGILLFLLFNKKIKIPERLFLIVFAIISFVLPQLFIQWWLHAQGGVMNNSNEDTFKIIINAYLNYKDVLEPWKVRLGLIPQALYTTFFHSNFFVLPMLFLVCWGAGRFMFRFRLNLAERSLLFSIFFIFLFNNAAPPYCGEWQMWGNWLARIYQGVFVVYLMYIVRLCGSHELDTAWRKVLTSMVILSAAASMYINTGGLYAAKITSYVYASFYKHGRPDTMQRNILFYGARPLGFPVHYENEVRD